MNLSKQHFNHSNTHINHQNNNDSPSAVTALSFFSTLLGQHVNKISLFFYPTQLMKLPVILVSNEVYTY